MRKEVEIGNMITVDSIGVGKKEDEICGKKGSLAQ